MVSMPLGALVNVAVPKRHPFMSARKDYLRARATVITDGRPCTFIVLDFNSFAPAQSEHFESISTRSFGRNTASVAHSPRRFAVTPLSAQCRCKEFCTMMSSIGNRNCHAHSILANFL